MITDAELARLALVASEGLDNLRCALDERADAEADHARQAHRELAQSCRFLRHSIVRLRASLTPSTGD